MAVVVKFVMVHGVVQQHQPGFPITGEHDFELRTNVSGKPALFSRWKNTTLSVMSPHFKLTEGTKLTAMAPNGSKGVIFVKRIVEQF
jgi:hypothetical protein